MAANFDWPLQQFDVENAFLHRDLEKEVYIDILLGYEKESWTNKVYKLKKSLYGLKQSPWAWFERFIKVMMKRGFHQCQGNHTLFIKHSHRGKITALIVHVVIEND